MGLPGATVGSGVKRNHIWGLLFAHKPVEEREGKSQGGHMEQRRVSGQRLLWGRWLWRAHSMTSLSKLIEYASSGDYPNINTAFVNSESIQAYQS